jgi:hypothetical protein
MSGQNPQLDLSQQVTINLPLGAWNTVLSLIAKGPWDVSDPLMQVIRQQIMQSQRPTSPIPFKPKVEEAG